jgi:hypothetical protein
MVMARESAVRRRNCTIPSPAESCSASITRIGFWTLPQWELSRSPATRRRINGKRINGKRTIEAKGQAEQSGTEQPATVLNSLMELTRAGGAIGIPGLYVTDDPGADHAAAKRGVLGLRIGLV